MPGGGGITSQVQLKVEVYDGAGVSVASERLFSYLRDEQGTVLGLVGETTGADPTRPPVAGRYFYTPFGEARVEAGLEAVRAGFDPSIAGVTAADGSTKSQGVAPGSVGGALTLRLSAAVDPQTYGGLILEKLQTDGSWLALLSAELAIGRATPRPEELAVLPLTGWQKDSTYRLRLTNVLKDTLGRSAPSLTISLPIPSDGAVAFERTWPALFENYLAAGNELGGLVPGGQPLLFQGMYVDPVLGLAITKNRIYDARSGAWLSPDPLDDIDSPNLYGFVSMRPHEKTDPLGLANDIDIRSNPEVRAEYCKRVPKDCSIWEREPVPAVEVRTSTATGDPRKDLGQLYAHGLSDVGAMATLGRRYSGNARQNAVVTSIGKTIEPAVPYIEALFYVSLFFAGPIPEAGAITRIGSGTEMAEAANSVWRLGPGPRGLKVEETFEKAGVLTGGRLPPNFRTIDFIDFDRGVATSMKSLDTAAPSYVKNPEAIFGEIRGYADSLAEFKGATSKKYNVVVTEADVTQRQLVLVIPDAEVNAAQRLALEKGAAYARERGLDVSIVTMK